MYLSDGIVIGVFSLLLFLTGTGQFSSIDFASEIRDGVLLAHRKLVTVEINLRPLCAQNQWSEALQSSINQTHQSNLRGFNGILFSIFESLCDSDGGCEVANVGVDTHCLQRYRPSKMAFVISYLFRSVWGLTSNNTWSRPAAPPCICMWTSLLACTWCSPSTLIKTISIFPFFIYSLNLTENELFEILLDAPQFQWSDKDCLQPRIVRLPGNSAWNIRFCFKSFVHLPPLLRQSVPLIERNIIVSFL